MMYSQLGLFSLVLLAASSSLSAEELEIPYVVKDACPFEGCAYGKWEVLEDTDVFIDPSKSSKVVGKLKKGSKAHVVTGIEYITPGEARITGKPYSHAESFDPDKPVYILNYIGEGSSIVFHDGKFIQTKIARTKTRCSEKPNWRYCWVEVLKEPSSAWWVQVKDLGWVLMGPNSLKPIDAYGYKAPYDKRMPSGLALLAPSAALGR